MFTRHLSAYLGDLVSNSSMRLLRSILLSLSGLHTYCKEEGLCRTFKSTYVQVSYEMILLCFYPLSILGTRYGGLWPLLWKEIPALWLVCWRFERQYCTALLLVVFIQGNKLTPKNGLAWHVLNHVHAHYWSSSGFDLHVVQWNTGLDMSSINIVN